MSADLRANAQNWLTLLPEVAGVNPSLIPGREFPQTRYNRFRELETKRPGCHRYRAFFGLNEVCLQ